VRRIISYSSMKTSLIFREKLEKKRNENYGVLVTKTHKNTTIYAKKLMEFVL
jgi:hypothetical protein